MLVTRIQGCSNAKHELVYGQVCLVFISSISLEDEATPLKNTSSMITNKQDYSVHQTGSFPSYCTVHQHLLKKDSPCQLLLGRIDYIFFIEQLLRLTTVKELTEEKSWEMVYELINVFF